VRHRAGCGVTTLRVDLHCHTHRSEDSQLSFAGLKRALEKRAIDVIAITDHNRIDGALELADRWVTPRVIVGEEIRTIEGEIVGLFLTSFIPPRLSPEETLSEIRRQGGFVYVPHPFDRIRRSVLRESALRRIAHAIDAVEVLNGRLHSSALNARAADFARERHLLATAGSDAHIGAEAGRVGLEMESFTSREEFARALVGARVFGSPSHPIVHVASAFAKYRKRYLPGWRSI